jgi:hypothetical protein
VCQETHEQSSRILFWGCPPVHRSEVDFSNDTGTPTEFSGEALESEAHTVAFAPPAEWHHNFTHNEHADRGSSGVFQVLCGHAKAVSYSEDSPLVGGVVDSGRRTLVGDKLYPSHLTRHVFGVVGHHSWSRSGLELLFLRGDTQRAEEATVKKNGREPIRTRQQL